MYFPNVLTGYTPVSLFSSIPQVAYYCAVFFTEKHPQDTKVSSRAVNTRGSVHWSYLVRG